MHRTAAELLLVMVPCWSSEITARLGASLEFLKYSCACTWRNSGRTGNYLLLIELYGGPVCASKVLPALAKKFFTILVEGVVKLGALGTAAWCSQICFFSAHQGTV